MMRIPVRSPKIRIAIGAFMLASWLTQALAEQNLATADSISYLDISYSLISGNWHALINGWWSPLFPFLVAIWLKLLNPHPVYEAVALHLFACASLIVSLFSFEYFMSTLLAFQKQIRNTAHENIPEHLPNDVIWLVGYSLFFWITAFLVPASLEQPDIIVFIIYLIACALSMQLISDTRGWSLYILLGVVLGLGYLAKSIMFPLAFVFYIVLLCHKGFIRILPKVLTSVAIFLACSLPFCLALSKSKGRLTFGDVGVMAYRHVMDMDEAISSGVDKPKPSLTPHIASYTNIINLGTYPPWADPSFGYKGTPFKFKFWRQINRTHVVLRYYFDLYAVQLAALLCGLLILIFSGNIKQFGNRFLHFKILWLPAFAGLASYAAMRADGRFLPGYTMAICAGIMASISFNDDVGVATKLSRIVGISICLVLMIQSFVQIGHEGVRLFERKNYSDWQVATALSHMGVNYGDRVCYMGSALTDHAWAHLARVKIVAEIPAEDVPNFRAADQVRRDEVIRWVRFTGAKAIITRAVPKSALGMGWKSVGDTDYYILLPQNLAF